MDETKWPLDFCPHESVYSTVSAYSIISTIQAGAANDLAFLRHTITFGFHEVSLMYGHIFLETGKKPNPNHEMPHLVSLGIHDHQVSNFSFFLDLYR